PGTAGVGLTSSATDPVMGNAFPTCSAVGFQEMRRLARCVRALVLALALLGVGSPRALHAQSRPSLQARAVVSAIVVDGRLDESAWAEAEPASDFLQFEPSEGAPASQRSEVRVLYGPSTLYVGAMLYDTDTSAIERTLGRRDGFNRADWFVVSIDSYLDRRTAHVFAVNAAGVQFDAVEEDGRGGPPGPQGMDASWDAIWSSAVRIASEGWVVEMAIPYSMLRFPRADTQTWGIQFSRHIPRLGEESQWPLVPRGERSNQVARFGNLTGITGIAPRRNLQLRPYTLARVQTRESADRPGETDGDGELDLGGDVKLGLGPNITLDATINPDFGQVESDPAVLNLTAFETIFEERRPFFMEGSQIYRFAAGPGQLLYTRRIGADAPIIGAAKLSGRTAGGLSFGVLGATTGDDFRPGRQYGVARATQQLGTASVAGGILTLYDSPAEAGRGRSVSAGADWDLRFLDNRYGVEGFAAVTNRWWTEVDIASESGHAGKVWVRKREGAWQGFGGVDVFSDDFNPNDLGQLRENNAYILLGNVEHQINANRPFGPFQRASAEVFAVQRIAYAEGLSQGFELDLRSRWVLHGFQTVDASVSFQRPFGGYDLYETRGLGPWQAPGSVEASLEFTTDERRSWRLEPQGGLELQEGGGRGYTAELRGNWSVSEHILLEANLEGEWGDDMLAWSSNETFLRTDAGWLIGRESGKPGGNVPADYVGFNDGGVLDILLAGVDTIGPNLYFVPIFGARDTRSMDLTLRGTYTLTPNLSFQLYGQLFLARGRYERMQILQNRDQLAAFDAFPKRNDFSFSSLQSNTVLRWEYRPGSTLYAVWTHGRRADRELSPLAPGGPSPYARSLRGQVADTFDVFPNNVF
ncbi:MAG: carbohydrate binding family 9 domain-containing protein, partial [Actinomycetota bacterium]|nr:carbohydrate binding family 9 domain-containing protein [Actinomycetota bacterium]